jgi:IS5 family transposase
MILENAPIDFADFSLCVYVIVDDFVKRLTRFGRAHRFGPAPDCSDSELIAVILIGESKGWDVETELLSNMRQHADLFPRLPTQSRFNRRRRQLTDLLNAVRQTLLCELDLAQDCQCIVDSLPVPVMHFHLVPGALPRSRGTEWIVNGAAYGQAASKKLTYYGYKLHLLVTGSGLILDFELTGANVGDLAAGVELLRGHRNLDVVADKAYISAPKAQELWELYNIRLLTVPRCNQKVQLPPEVAARRNGFRQMIETINNQLNAQFNIETNHAHSFQGLCARLVAKLTAHTLAIYINRLLGRHDWLNIKQLAFN